MASYLDSRLGSLISTLLIWAIPVIPGRMENICLLSRSLINSSCEGRHGLGPTKAHGTKKDID